MDLRSENPYWLLKNGLINTYPSLQKNIKADIVVIGAGITGALTAWYLCNAGFNITVVDKRHVSMGSTSACTGLLQFELDTPLHELLKKVGASNAHTLLQTLSTGNLYLRKYFQNAPNKL